MGENTNISWCDHTFNPWIGCAKVSDGCKNCYAETMSKRFGANLWGPTAHRRVTSDAYWKQPLKWDRAAARDGVRRKVFCGSMCDVFEDPPTQEVWLVNLIELISVTPNLDWLLLTKRPENINRLMDAPARKNIWFGTSVENQEQADKRIPILIQTPAAVRFLSLEPLLGPIEIDTIKGPVFPGGFETHPWTKILQSKQISWVIVGGESGPHARQCEIAWIEDIVSQCRAANVPVHVKQDSGRYPGQQGRIPDKYWVKEWPR